MCVYLYCSRTRILTHRAVRFVQSCVQGWRRSIRRPNSSTFRALKKLQDVQTIYKNCPESKRAVFQATDVLFPDVPARRLTILPAKPRASHFYENHSSFVRVPAYLSTSSFGSRPQCFFLKTSFSAQFCTVFSRPYLKARAAMQMQGQTVLSVVRRYTGNREMLRKNIGSYRINCCPAHVF